jgi:hypothetical protein
VQRETEVVLARRMRQGGGCVQFEGLDGADWRSVTDYAGSVAPRSGSTVVAIGAMRTAAQSAANGVEGVRRVGHEYGTEGPRKEDSTTATSSVRIAPVAWGIKVPGT